MPPTEKRGRVHTSTVTVAVIDPDVAVSDAYARREDDDFRIEWFSGTGKGGQNRNKVQCSCRVIHIPTGITETRQGRERTSNLTSAKAAIFIALDAAARGESSFKQATDRKEQVGSGMRGDKRRTYRFQDDQVNDHLTNKTASTKAVMKGDIDLLW